jgi:type II protein arginine methyltransferase
VKDLKSHRNKRFKTLKLKIDVTGMIHGIIGYFDCKLYDDIILSIVPETHSKNMTSWFPIVFPIRTPKLVKKGSSIEVFFSREVDKNKVWYEWCLMTNNDVTPIHNTNGRSSFVGL